MTDRKVIVFDVDGTLTNPDHRLHYLRSETKNWNAFLEAAKYDEPNHQVMDIFKKYANDVIYNSNSEYFPIVVSARNERHRNLTYNWFVKQFNGLPTIYHVPLLLRADDDYRKDSIVKEEILKTKIIPEYGMPYAVYDDRPMVVKMWKSHGIFVFDCNQRGEDF